MPEQPLVSTGSSGIQFFDSLLPLTQSVRYPLVPYHCALLVLLTGDYVAPLVTKYFLSNLYLEKQRTFLGVESIVNMALLTYLGCFLSKGITC